MLALSRLSWVYVPLALAAAGACADGEAGFGADDDASGGSSGTGAGGTGGSGGGQPLVLETFCEDTCEAQQALECENDPSREVCVTRCLHQPLPEPGDDCFEEEMAVLNCQYEHRETAFQCDFAGKTEAAAGVCSEEIMQAVVECGGL